MAQQAVRRYAALYRCYNRPRLNDVSGIFEVYHRGVEPGPSFVEVAEVQDVSSQLHVLVSCEA